MGTPSEEQSEFYGKVKLTEGSNEVNRSVMTPLCRARNPKTDKNLGTFSRKCSIAEIDIAGADSTLLATQTKGSKYKHYKVAVNGVRVKPGSRVDLHHGDRIQLHSASTPEAEALSCTYYVRTTSTLRLHPRDKLIVSFTPPRPHWPHDTGAGASASATPQHTPFAAQAATPRSGRPGPGSRIKRTPTSTKRSPEPGGVGRSPASSAQPEARDPVPVYARQAAEPAAAAHAASHDTSPAPKLVATTEPATPTTIIRPAKRPFQDTDASQHLGCGSKGSENGGDLRGGVHSAAANKRPKVEDQDAAPSYSVIRTGTTPRKQSVAKVASLAVPGPSPAPASLFQRRQPAHTVQLPRGTGSVASNGNSSDSGSAPKNEQGRKNDTAAHSRKKSRSQTPPLALAKTATPPQLVAPAMPQDVSPPMLGFQPNVIMTFVSFSQGGVGEEISKLVETIEFFHSRINGAHIKMYPSPNAKDSNIDAFKLKFPQLAQHVVRKTGADHRVLFDAIQHAYDDHPGQAAGCKKLVFACTPKRRPFYKASLEKYNHKYNAAHGRYDYDIINVVDESDLPDPRLRQA